MVYHLLGEGGIVLKLEKDPRDNTYFPQVARATSVVGFSSHMSPKKGANSPDVTPLPAKQSNKKTLELSPDSQKAVSCPNSVKGRTGSWKKRARGCVTTVPNLEIHVGGRETGDAVESASSGESVAQRQNFYHTCFS
jgi:hypothetical protein